MPCACCARAPTSVMVLTCGNKDLPWYKPSVTHGGLTYPHMTPGVIPIFNNHGKFSHGHGIFWLSGDGRGGDFLRHNPQGFYPSGCQSPIKYPHSTWYIIKKYHIYIDCNCFFVCLIQLQCNFHFVWVCGVVCAPFYAWRGSVLKTLWHWVARLLVFLLLLSHQHVW